MYKVSGGLRNFRCFCHVYLPDLEFCHYLVTNLSNVLKLYRKIILFRFNYQNCACGSIKRLSLRVQRPPSMTILKSVEQFFAVNARCIQPLYHKRAR